jgi:hypothetical protein
MVPITFKFVQERAMIIASTQSPSKPARALRVLVVDDDVHKGSAIAEFLAWKGHDARAFGTATEGPS